MRRFNLTGLVCPWLAPVQNRKIFRLIRKVSRRFGNKSVGTIASRANRRGERTARTHQADTAHGQPSITRALLLAQSQLPIQLVEPNGSFELARAHPKHEFHPTGSTGGFRHSRWPDASRETSAQRQVLQKTFQPHRCGLISITVTQTLIVVGKPYESSEHPAASVLLNEILGSNDCAGLNGAERWPHLVAVANS